MTNYVARIAGLTHRYDDVVALDNVNLEIPTGCMIGFIGPDGVGKSTLLGLIAGARAIQVGSLCLLGGDMRSRRHRTFVNPQIAYMPQGLGKNLYATLSVFENVDFFGRLFGLEKSERRLRIKELLKSTGMDHFADRPAGKLSGGMKQKLGLCCALIHNPDLLILDEPTHRGGSSFPQAILGTYRAYSIAQSGYECSGGYSLHGRSRTVLTGWWL